VEWKNFLVEQGKPVMRIGVLGIFLATLLAASPPVRAEPPTLLGFPNPPLIDEVDGKVVGPAAVLASELAKFVGLSPSIEIQPLPRALATLEAGNRIIPLLTRTKGREHRYTWIAEIFIDELAFHTVAPNPRITDVKAAQAFKSIGVREGSSSHAFLLSHDFGAAIVADPVAEYAARKLALGRVDAWFTSKTMGHEVWVRENLPLSRLQVGETVGHSVYWIAATKDVSPDLVRKMAERFHEMKADGTYDRIFSVLKAE
jgi:polar amino acid transport system substrate-binding protein